MGSKQTCQDHFFLPHAPLGTVILKVWVQISDVDPQNQMNADPTGSGSTSLVQIQTTQLLKNQSMRKCRQLTWRHYPWNIEDD